MIKETIMLMHYKYYSRGVAAALMVMYFTMPVAFAKDDNDEGFGEISSSKYNGEDLGKQLKSAQINAKFKQECSDCHIPYSPGLLPAESWRKIMSGLDKHFGSDASIAVQDNREIITFLVNNASNRWSSQAAPLRITESAWFKEKHSSREISSSVWKNPKVKSPSNCSACHTRAASGDFSEDNITIPK
jgi:mono/diheme cytochrome c family protein